LYQFVDAYFKVSFIISKAIALQLDYKSKLHNTQKNNNYNENSKKNIEPIIAIVIKQ